MTKKFHTKTLKFEVKKSINKLPGNIILRKDIKDLCSSHQISRCLKELIEMGVLIRIGYGVYAKSYISENLKRPVIQGGFDQACREALTKLGVKWEPGSSEQAYNSGRSTQVPVRIIVKLKSRYRGQLKHGNRKLIIEKRINSK